MKSGIYYHERIERWSVFEAELKGKTEGNPFEDWEIQGIFTSEKEEKIAAGFYDGDGIYKIRFMPSYIGRYHFKIYGTFSDTVYEGDFVSENPGKENHGPVRVSDTYHFKYEDGKPYYCIGTTCYVWELQPDEIIKKTLETLQNGAFNKLRFCLFPKHYCYNLKEPRAYPYEGIPMDSKVLTKENFQEFTGKTDGNHWNFKVFNTEYFRHIDNCIEALAALGIEADLILFHPYDRWGFSKMGRENDLFYLNYVISRFSAYRNVWWSLANEYDLLEEKTEEDWEAFAALIERRDVYGHLKSIHNWHKFYDFTRAWVTHCSIQRQDIYKTAELADQWRDKYKKPVVLDEIAYEGNLEHGWGNITGEEMTRRFWEAACRGTYPGHSETLLNGEEILWWAHGGVLSGESYKRAAFLRKIMSETPGGGLKPYEKCGWDEVCAVPECCHVQENGVYPYYLIYYSFMRPLFREYYFDDVSEFEVSVIDTWEMKIEKRGIFKGKFKIELPGKQYMAVQIKQYS